jgi:type I restriction enzyme R subunit
VSAAAFLYEQMLGRATRRCDDIGKEVFHVFDAVDLYSGLEAVSTMKPVVADPKVSFAQLVEELAAAKTKEVAENVLEQLIAKLQSKHRRIKGSAADQFEMAAGMAPTRSSSHAASPHVETRQGRGLSAQPL